MRQQRDPGRSWHLAVLSTHPIQYHTPWFQAMHQHPSIDLEVLFAHRASPRDQAKAGFGVDFEWDIPLLEGYQSRFLENRARHPGLDFWGIDIPCVGDILREGHFDAVLVHGWHFKGAWQTLLACRKLEIPVLVRSDSQLGGRSLAKSLVKWLPYRFFIRRLDACLCVGQRSREYFLHYGASAERIFRVPHVLDDRWFSEAPDDDQRAALRREYEIPESAFVPLFVGKLKEMKRPLDFLKACTGLDQDGVFALLAGDGELRSECEQLLRHGGGKGRFLGFVNQSEMPRIYALADVLVLPSDARETWGLVLNEAMSQGVPCVVSRDVGSAEDLIIDGQTGRIFPGGDVGALTQCLMSLLKDRMLLKKMGENAKSRAAEYRPQEAVRGVLKALSVVNARIE